MGSFTGRENQYIQLVKVLYCKLLTKDKQPPAFLLGVRPRFKHIITPAKEVMFLTVFVCGFVSLFVNKITQKLLDGF